MDKTTLDADTIFVLANKDTAVQAAVENRAAKIAVRARRNLARANIKANVDVKPHPLPTGRASRNVVVTVHDDKDRRRAGRTLRQTSREVRR